MKRTKNKRIKVGINGFGKIGMTTGALLLGRGHEIVAINDLAPPKALATLYRSAYPETEVKYGNNSISLDGVEIPIIGKREPKDLGWGQYGGGDDVFAIESTGFFRTREKVATHLEAGAKKVVLTVPAKDELDAMIVLGANDKDLRPFHDIVSNASCTTNSIGRPCMVLHAKFGIISGLLTTVHSATNDQRVVGGIHDDPYRAACTLGNIIPTSTGAAAAIGKIIPELDGRLNGGAIRVPTATGSISILNLVLDGKYSVEEINACLHMATADSHVMHYFDHELDAPTLKDIVGRPESCLIDPKSTIAIQKGETTHVQIQCWYDNEFGYSSRVVDLLELMSISHD